MYHISEEFNEQTPGKTYGHRFRGSFCIESLRSFLWSHMLHYMHANIDRRKIHQPSAEIFYSSTSSISDVKEMWSLDRERNVSFWDCQHL